MRRWLSGMAPRRRRFVIGLLAVVVLGIGAIIAGDITTSASASAAPQASGPGDRTPRSSHTTTVILVPGYGGSRNSLEWLADNIRSTGRIAIVMRLPGDGTGDLNAQAKVLRSTADRVAHTGSTVDVVGFSAGGVVVRLWIASYGGAAVVHHVITLGAPLHGTILAAVGQALVPSACPVACQQLEPGSLLLRTLNARPTSPGIAWMSVWSTDDKTVDPPDSARLSGAVNVAAQSICSGEFISHGDLPLDPLVTGLVLSALGPGAIPIPTSSDCATLQRGHNRVLFFN